MKKKQLILALTIVMLVMAFSVTVFAAENTVEFTLGTSNPNVAAGEEFTVTVAMPVNTGFASLKATVSFDTKDLTYVSTTTGEAFKDEKFIIFDENIANGELYIRVMDPSTLTGSVSATGELLVIKFKTNADYDGATEIKITVGENDICGDAASGYSTDFTIKGAETATHTHTPTTVKGKDATCTEKGLTDGVKCEGCGEWLTKQEEIPALGHKEVIDAAVDATCTEAGKTEGKHCERCNEVLVPQTEVSATGHKYGDWTIVKEATTEEEGASERVCENCGEKETKTIAKLEKQGVSTIVIIAIVIGVIGVALVVGICFYQIQRKKRA
ncbi:MAG: hypothetical protein IJX55_02635 [Clostridia bacterium]|nr:hypothetical protein [Clostridia bacterium]